MQAEQVYKRFLEYLQELKKRRLWMTISAVIFGTFLGIRAWNTPWMYVSNTVFHPSAEQPGNVSLENPAALLFGTGFSTGESGQMVGILQSRYMAEEVSSDSIEIDSVGKRLLADIINEHYPRKTSLLQRFFDLFEGEKPPPNLYGKIYRTGKIIQRSQTMKVTDEGFIQMKVTMRGKKLTRYVSEGLVQNLDDYFRSQKSEKADQNVTFFTLRADSIKNELDQVSRQIAKQADMRYSISARYQVSLRELEAKYDVLKQMYVTLIINREQAVSRKQENTPIVQVLDYPRPPYQVLKTSVGLYVLAGMILGALLVGIFFLRNMIIADAMQVLLFVLQPVSADQKDD